MTGEDFVFVETTSTNLYDKMDAGHLHPERVNTIRILKELEQKGVVELKMLDRLVTIGKVRTLASGDKTLHCIEMGDVDVDYGLIALKAVTVDNAGTSIIACKSGEILFSGIRPYLNKITLVPSNIGECICSGEFYVLKAKDKRLAMGYLWLILRSEFVYNQSRHLAVGSLRPRLEEDDIEDLIIPLLKDSNLVSEINSCVSDALRKYYPALQKLRLAETSFLKSIDLPAPPKLPSLFFGYAEQPSDSPRPFYRIDPLFFHPMYYEKIKKQLNLWAKSHGGEVERLENLCVPKGIGRWKPRVRNQNGSTPRFGVDNVTEIGISWDCKYVDVAPKQDKKFLRRNDILISSTGTGSTGRIEIFNEDVPAITDGHITIVRLNPTINPYYILGYLRSEYGKRQLLRMERGTSGQIEMYAEDIQNLLVPISHDSKIVKKAVSKIKKAYDDMQTAKKILYKAKSQLTRSILNLDVTDKLDYLDTTMPKPKWRIVRP